MKLEHYWRSRFVPCGLIRLSCRFGAIEFAAFSWYGFGSEDSDEFSLGPLWFWWEGR